MSKKTRQILQDINLALAIVALALAYIALASCGPAVKMTTEQRDSVTIHVRDSIRFRDSLILVPVPEGSDKANLPDTDTSYLSTGIAESTAYVKDGQLHHSLRNKAGKDGGEGTDPLPQDRRARGGAEGAVEVAALHPGPRLCGTDCRSCVDDLETITSGIIFVTVTKKFFISDLVQKIERSHVVRYGFFS